jgi:hypothetical protein
MYFSMPQMGFTETVKVDDFVYLHDIRIGMPNYMYLHSISKYITMITVTHCGP